MNSEWTLNERLILTVALVTDAAVDAITAGADAVTGGGARLAAAAAGRVTTAGAAAGRRDAAGTRRLATGRLTTADAAVEAWWRAGASRRDAADADAVEVDWRGRRQRRWNGWRQSRWRLRLDVVDEIEACCFGRPACGLASNFASIDAE